jgi:hypothetical protein
MLRVAITHFVTTESRLLVIFAVLGDRFEYALKSSTGRRALGYQLSRKDSLSSAFRVSRDFVHSSSGTAPVELDGRQVPIEHSPLQPAAAAFSRNPHQVLQQRRPNSLAAQVRIHVQVLPIESWLGPETWNRLRRTRQSPRIPGHNAPTAPRLRA